jgi:hypothetical protein
MARAGPDLDAGAPPVGPEARRSLLLLWAPFVVGALHAYAAIRGRDRTGWVGLVLHLAMTVVAVVMPIRESIGG